MTQIQGPNSSSTGESATEALVEPPRSPRLAQNEPLSGYEWPELDVDEVRRVLDGSW